MSTCQCLIGLLLGAFLTLGCHKYDIESDIFSPDTGAPGLAQAFKNGNYWEAGVYLLSNPERATVSIQFATLSAEEGTREIITLGSFSMPLTDGEYAVVKNYEDRPATVITAFYDTFDDDIPQSESPINDNKKSKVELEVDEAAGVLRGTFDLYFKGEVNRGLKIKLTSGTFVVPLPQ